MFRWDKVEEQTLFDMTVKMYRDPFVALKTAIVPEHGLELDHYAYKYLGSELYMYRILDVNFDSYIEERGDMSRVQKVFIPLVEDTGLTIL